MKVWTVVQSLFECLCKVTLQSAQCLSAARAEFMTAHTNNLQSGNWCCSSCNHGTPSCGSRDGFCGLIFHSLVQEVLKWPTRCRGVTAAQAALSALKKSSLTRCGECHTGIRAFKTSLSVCGYIYRLWIFYLHPLRPEHGNNKTI